MGKIPAALRRTVIQRAGDRCEYCCLSQVGQAATFHIDHVIPIVAGGETQLDNLALACVSCSLRKAARQTVTDPETKDVVPVFNPRKQRWKEHFVWEDVQVRGCDKIGRATVYALQMNRPIMLAIRSEESLLGRHPPP